MCVVAADGGECGREVKRDGHIECDALAWRAGGDAGRPVVGGVRGEGVRSSIGSPCPFSCLLAAARCTLYGRHVRGPTSR